MLNTSELNIYLNRFLGDFIPIVPFLAVLMSQNGLSLSQISLAFFSLAATVLVLELPTGMLADKVSVKAILLLSRFFKLIAFVTIFALPNLTGSILGMILWGIASALDSGAFQSYLFNYVRKIRNTQYFEKVYARSITASLIGLLSATAVSTQIDRIGYEVIQIIGLTALTLSFLSALFLSKVCEVKSVEAENTTNQSFKHTFKTIWHAPLLFSLLAIGILSGGIKGTLDDYTSLLLANKELALTTIGYALLMFEIVKSSGAFLSQWIKIGNLSQSILLGLFGICFFLAGVSGPLISITALLLIIIFDAMLWVHNDSAIQNLANDRNRATLASIKNFGTEILAATVMLFIFLVGDFSPLSSVYMILGLLLVASSLLITPYIATQNKSN